MMISRQTTTTTTKKNRQKRIKIKNIIYNSLKKKYELKLGLLISDNLASTTYTCLNNPSYLLVMLISNVN